MPDIVRRILVHLLYILAHVLAFTGIAMIIYGTVAKLTGQMWGPVEPLIKPTSVYLTLVGLFVTATAIYAPPKLVPPMELSLYMTAPVAIIMVFIAGYVEAAHGLPESVIDGIALFTIAGGLIRIFPRPDLFEAHRWAKKNEQPAAEGSGEAADQKAASA